MLGVVQQFRNSVKLTTAMLYRVHYRAGLLHQKSHTYGADYVMQKSKCLSLQIMHYCKSVLSSYHSTVQGIVKKKKTTTNN